MKVGVGRVDIIGLGKERIFLSYPRTHDGVLYSYRVPGIW